MCTYIVVCVLLVQREAVGCFPIDSEISRVREIDTSAYLDEFVSKGTQVKKVDIHQVVIFFLLLYLMTTIIWLLSRSLFYDIL